MAGTDANVYLIMHGKGGIQSPKIHLKNNSTKKPFQKGGVDVFSVIFNEDLGSLTAIK